jgi:DNA-directed RNA polymerase specialized sigma24 family protein
MYEPLTSTAGDVQNRLAIILGELADEPDAQGVTELQAVQLLAEIASHIEQDVTTAMHRAHLAGYTLDRIANVVGTSRQAVWNRLNRAGLLAPR